jgi:hypothetical protein
MMTSYLEFATEDGGTILVEIDEKEIKREAGVQKAGVKEILQGAVAQARTTIDAALEAVVRHNAKAFINAVGGMIDPPDAVEMTFGLKGTGEGGNFAIAKVSGEASYSITLKWDNRSQPKA